MIINYNKNPNVMRPAETARLIVTTFSTIPDSYELTNIVYQWLSEYAKLQFDMPDKKVLKQIKSSNFGNLSDLLKTGSCKHNWMNQIMDLEPVRERALNIIVTLCRWPEWFIHTEKYLSSIADNLNEHLSEINAITFYEDGERICPYSDSLVLSDDLYAVIRQQSQYVEQFCSKKGIKSPITAEDIINELKIIYNQSFNSSYVAHPFESGFFNSIKHIRKNSYKVITQMTRIRSGNSKAEDFGRSESRSPVSDIPGVMEFLHRLGFNKPSCPGVLSNIFYGTMGNTGIQSNPGQIKLDKDLLYFDVAPGLGPAAKIRYVFNICMLAQNFLSPLADLCKQADEKYDSFSENYIEQLESVIAEVPLMEDVYGIDATGYSDYLIRHIYRYLMRMYGIPEYLINSIMEILSAPLMIKNKLYPVKFGSMQGCKLLVFIMNHANRIIGIISRRLQAKYGRKVIPDSRHNAGDDVITVSYSGKFSKDNIMDEMKVFAFFNCSVNMSKYAWLEQDGYFDFCSKYFCWDEGHIIPISGIPPKLCGKQFLCVKSFSEIFKVLAKTETKRNLISDIVEKNKQWLFDDWRSGITLDNVLGIEWTLEDKIQAASQFSYELGGLAEDSEVDIALTAKHACALLEKLLARYRFKPIGVFAVIQKLGILDTELGKALGTVDRLAAKEIMNSIAILKDCRKTGLYDIKEVKRCCMLINRLERNIIKGLSTSASGSTYHRITLDRDIDTFILDDDQDTPLVDALEKPANQLQLALFVQSLSDDNYTQIDNLRRYVQVSILLNVLKDKIFSRNHFGYINYYARDDDNQVIRLTSDSRYNSDSYAKNGNPGCHKELDEILNPHLRQFVELTRGNYELISKIVNCSSDVLKGTWEEILTKSMETIHRSILSDSLRSAADSIQEQCYKHAINQLLGK